MVHDHDLVLAPVPSEATLEPNHLAMPDLSLVSFRSCRSDDDHHRIPDFDCSSGSECMLEEQVSSRTIIVVSARHDQVLAIEAIEPSFRLPILTQEAVIREISCDHNDVRIKRIDLPNSLLKD